MSALAAIDFAGLGKAAAATLIITSVFALVMGALIVTTARAAESRRTGHGGASLGYSAAMVLSGAVLAALVVAGLLVMTAK